MSQSLREVVVLGKGELAIRVSRWFTEQPSYRLACVVPVVPEPAWAPSLSEWAKEHQVAVVESGHFDQVSAVIGDGPVDLAVSVFYDKIIKPRFIERCGRILNIHNGPLPRYQGVSPINWALKNGEVEHGVTIHELTAGIDTGPIVSQVKYSIYPEIDEVIDVFERSIEYATVLFERTMPLLDHIRPRRQDESQALYYNRRQDDLLGERRGFTRSVSTA